MQMEEWHEWSLSVLSDLLILDDYNSTVKALIDHAKSFWDKLDFNIREVEKAIQLCLEAKVKIVKDPTQIHQTEVLFNKI